MATNSELLTIRMTFQGNPKCSDYGARLYFKIDYNFGGSKVSVKADMRDISVWAFDGRKFLCMKSVVNLKFLVVIYSSKDCRERYLKHLLRGLSMRVYIIRELIASQQFNFLM